MRIIQPYGFQPNKYGEFIHRRERRSRLFGPPGEIAGLAILPLALILDFIRWLVASRLRRWLFPILRIVKAGRLMAAGFSLDRSSTQPTAGPRLRRMEKSGPQT